MLFSVEIKILNVFHYNMNLQLESPVFSLCHSSTCGYNYLRAGGREGCLYLLDTTGDKFEEITVSITFNIFHHLTNVAHM